MDMEDTLLLRPLVHPVVCEFLQQRALLFELMRALGSPLNILFPQLIGDNASAFQNVLDRHRIAGRINFAHKTTQSASLVRQAAVTEKISLDAASANELKAGLVAGFTGSRLEATGPNKTTEFLLPCLLHDVVINVDSISEVQQILALRHNLTIRQNTKILIRLSGFSTATTAALTKSSRFGIPLAELEAILTLLKQHDHELTLLGLAFHLDSRSVEERAIAVESCLLLLDELLERGFCPRILNIGGGFGINYLAHQSDWDNYITALQKAALGARSSLTWQGATFGLSVNKGVLKGDLNISDYYRSDAGARFLEDLLASQLVSQNMSIAQFLALNMIELWIEPGRSLVDQCGITVGMVADVRRASGGEQLITLYMNRRDTTFEDTEVFVDPIVIYQEGEPSCGTQHVPVYFAGNLCQESDMITRHITNLPRLPRRGDLVVFPNTAGYFSDFSATTAMMHPVARKVAIQQKGNQFSWYLDEQYTPIY